MTRDYVALYLALSQYQYSAANFGSLLFLTVARLFPIITLSPFFGGKILPRPVKVGFGLALFAVMLPTLLVVTKTPLEFNTTLLLLFLKELFIGLILGLLMLLPFWAVENAGMLTDQQRGGASLQINDPTMQSQSSPFGTLYNFTLIYIFYLFDGPFLFLEAIIESFKVIPPDEFLSRLFFNKELPLWGVFIDLLNTTMKLAVQLGAPALLAIVMTDMFLGIINRMAPQVMITFLGMPLKSLLAIGVVCIGWNILVNQFGKEALEWVIKIHTLIPTFSVGKDL